MGRKQHPPVRIPQGRAPVAAPRATDLKAGDVVRDDPTSPQLDGINTPSQLDPRAPMENDAAPTRLDFENLKYRNEVHAFIIARLIQLLPAGAQGELAPLLETETVIVAEA